MKDYKKEFLKPLPVSLQLMFEELTNNRFTNHEFENKASIQKHRRYQKKVISGYGNIMKLINRTYK